MAWCASSDRWRREHRPVVLLNPALRLSLTPDGEGVTYSAGTPRAQLLLADGWPTSRFPRSFLTIAVAVVTCRSPLRQAQRRLERIGVNRHFVPFPTNRVPSVTPRATVKFS